MSREVHGLSLLRSHRVRVICLSVSFSELRRVHGLSQLWPHRSSHLSSNEFIFQSEGVSVAAEKLIDEVGTTLLLRMVVDQEPKKVKTSSLDMVLNRLSPRSLKTNREYGQDDVGFKVPFEAITDEKAKDAQFVDFLVSSLFFKSDASVDN